MFKKGSGFFAEFKKFITRGNIIDMSVGVIVGGAFTAIVNGLTENILKPIINWFLALILKKDSLSDVYTFLKRVDKNIVDDTGTIIGKEADLTQSIYIDWGAFINAIINFLIIAFVLFCIVKAINSISDSQKKFADIKTRIEYKQAHNIKLSKKELAFLKEEETRIAAEEEAARIAEEEEANKPKPITTEDLLTEIRDLLKSK